MSDIAIATENLGKKYRLGAAAQPYQTLRESLIRAMSAPVRVAARWAHGSAAANEGGNRPDFWALRGVTLDVKHGDVLGIIGRNGVGKSTLLKLLSQITEPTEGSIGINGRVASLLEVGTGFHPELTGRENVFLNGAILGMSRREIQRKFDEIVMFAEVQRFIDTPIKHYSSGMYLRLAFSVAAHLEPEILIVDEVLAVGDVVFQKKCLGKMGDVAKEGRTILFVSHDLGAIGTLCNRAVVLDHGSIVYRGGAPDAISHYAHLVEDDARSSRDLRDWTYRSGSRSARILWGSVSGQEGNAHLACLTMGDTLVIQFDVACDPTISLGDLRFSLVISTVSGIRVLHISNEDDNFVFPAAARARVTVRLPGLPLFPGSYVVSLWVGSPHYDDYDYLRDCLRFDVVQGEAPLRSYKMSWYNGLVYHPSQWSVDNTMVVTQGASTRTLSS
jgi:lipopolysaccharide transport system ATP-binding protein